MPIHPTLHASSYIHPADIRALQSKSILLRLLSRYTSARTCGGIRGFVCPFHCRPRSRAPRMQVRMIGGVACAVCSSCGMAGDAFAVLERLEGLRSFPAQVRRVAALSGYTLRPANSVCRRHVPRPTRPMPAAACRAAQRD